MNTSKKALQTLGGNMLIFVQSIVLTPLVIKTSGPETYGGYVIIISFLGMIFGISSFGIGIMAKRQLPSIGHFEARSTIFYKQFWFQILSISSLATITSALFVAAQGLGIFNLEGLSPWMILAYLISYALYSQYADYFRYTHRVGVFNLATVANPYLFVGLVLLTYYVQGILNIGSMIISLILSNVIVGIGIAILAFRELGVSVKWPSGSDIKKEMLIGFPVVLTYLTDVFLAHADKYIIAATLTVKDVGMYVPAYMLGSLVMILPRALGVVLPPIIAKLVDNSEEENAKEIISLYRHLHLIFSIPFVMGSLVIGKDILAIFTTPEIAEISQDVVWILAISSIFYGLSIINSTILQIRLKYKTWFYINLVAALASILLNLIILQFVPNILVCATTTLLSYTASYCLLSRKIHNDPLYTPVSGRTILKILLFSCVMAALMKACSGMLGHVSAASSFALAAIGATIYIFMLYVDIELRKILSASLFFTKK